MQILKLRNVAILALAATFAFGAAVTPVRSTRGFEMSNLDSTCQPCDDFYKYAAGGWLKNNPIPAAYPTWGRFDVLQKENEDNLHTLLEEASKNTSARKGSPEQKIGDFYASAMNEERINSDGLKPVLPELERIARIKDRDTLQEEFAHLNRFQLAVPFGITSTQDAKDSAQVIALIYPSGLALPDRDYYLNDDADSVKIRTEYQKHLARMFQLLGDSDAAIPAEVKTVMDLETVLAKASLSRVDRRDPDKTYHRMSISEIQAVAPAIRWENFYRNVGLGKNFDANIPQPEFLKEVNKQIAELPLDAWKTYLRWQFINNVAAFLSKDFVDQNFAFYGKTVNGTEENLPRWKRAVQSTDNEIGEALGEVYVKRYFPPEAKARMRQIIDNMKAALRDDISTLEWMGPDTRRQATAKLDAFVEKIGYPDKWRDYSTLTIDRGPWVLNEIRANEFEFTRELNQIGKPVDRTEWDMTPPTVNAGYYTSKNELVFPAGILQPPFFNPDADDAINYGAIAGVIGHEMTHGFDDQGAKFDGQGNRKNWWSPDDLKRFEERSNCVVQQFDGFVVDGDIHHIGKLVVGESVADLGGLTIAYRAYRKSIEGKPRPDNIDGFTPEQRFFLGWAQVWAENDRPEFARKIARVDPHPLGKFRVNGPLSNMAEFAEAFGCKAKQPMVRDEDKRCRIW